MVVVDFHGWMGMTQGNQEIGKYFNAQFNGDVYSKMAGGFFSTWAQESLSNTKAVLVEYPKNTRSIEECLNNDYPGRTYNAIMNILASNEGSSSGTSGSSSNGEVENGSTGNNVKVIQQDLRGLGYEINTIDGSFGTETKTAVQTFQKNNALYVDGIVGNSTMACIKQKVEYVQTLLKDAGYTFGSVDGYFGDATKNEVERFQIDAKLYVDGIVGNVTLAKLKEYADKSISDYPQGVIEDGWVKGNSGSWYYFNDGKPLTGVWTINDLFMYFDTNGVLVTNKNIVIPGYGLAYIDEVGTCSFIKNESYMSLIKISDYKNTEAFSAKGFNHIFEGEINGKDEIAGCHSPNYYANALGKPFGKEVTVGTSEAFESQISNEAGDKIYVKLLRPGMEHTWFPKSWSVQKTIDVIVEAAEKGVKTTQGKTTVIEAQVEGFIIRVVKKSEGILTAFPLCNVVINKVLTRLAKEGKELNSLPKIQVDDKKYETTEGNEENGGEEKNEGEDDGDVEI